MLVGVAVGEAVGVLVGVWVDVFVGVCVGVGVLLQDADEYTVVLASLFTNVPEQVKLTL